MLEASRRTIYHINYMENSIEETAKYDYMIEVMEMMETEEEVPENMKIVKDLQRVLVMEGVMSCQAYLWLMQNMSYGGRWEMNTVVTRNETIVYARLEVMKQAFLEAKAARAAEREAQQQQPALQQEPTAMAVEVVELSSLLEPSSQRSTQAPLG